MSEFTIESAKQFLKDNGYYTDNLWHIEDVTSKYECTEKEAQTVLNDILSGEWFIGEVNASINITSEAYCLEKIKSKYFLVSGFWKDSKEKFESYLVQEYDFEDDQQADDEAVFFYGLSSDDLDELIIEKWNSPHDFVITSYEETTLN